MAGEVIPEPAVPHDHDADIAIVLIVRRIDEVADPTHILTQKSTGSRSRDERCRRCPRRGTDPAHDGSKGMPDLT